MWKNNAAASHRNASNEFIYIYVFICIYIYEFIYINFLYFLRVTFELMWGGISPQTCESCFKSEGIKASLADATPKSITVPFSVCARMSACVCV